MTDDETAEGGAVTEARDVIAFGLDNWVGEELTKTVWEQADAILQALEAEGYQVGRFEAIGMWCDNEDVLGLHERDDFCDDEPRCVRVYRRTDQEAERDG